MKVGFIGCGNMGGAMARAVCRVADPAGVVLANRTPAKAQALARALGCRTGSNEDAAGSGLVFLGVKPQMMAGLLAPCSLCLPPGQPGASGSSCAPWPPA